MANFRISAILGLALLGLTLVPGVTANCAVDTTEGKAGWGRFCAFPYEGCATNPQTSMYTASPTRYTQINGLWTQCVQIVVIDQAVCRERAGFPNNATRCCDTMFNKFKLNARRACWGSIASYTVQRPGGNVSGDLTSFVWEAVGRNRSQTIVKFTPLNLHPATADGVEICFSLRKPCATMAAFTNGKPLQYALYDKKTATTYNGTKSKAYECCPTNTMVLGQ